MIDNLSQALHVHTCCVVTLTITLVIIQWPRLIVDTGQWSEKKKKKGEWIKKRNIFLFWIWVNVAFCYCFSQSDALKEEMFKLNCGFDFPMWWTPPPLPLSMITKFDQNFSSSTHPRDSDHLDCCREAEHVFVSRVHRVPGSMCLQLLCNFFVATFCKFVATFFATFFKLQKVAKQVAKIVAQIVAKSWIVCVQKIGKNSCKKVGGKKLHNSCNKVAKSCITVANT